MAQNKND